MHIVAKYWGLRAFQTKPKPTKLKVANMMVDMEDDNVVTNMGHTA